MAKQKKGEDLTPNKQVELITMYGTSKSKFHKPGEETHVHPDMVEHYRKRGLTTDEPTEDESGEGGEEI